MRLGLPSAEQPRQSPHERASALLLARLYRGEAPWLRAVTTGSVLPHNPMNEARFHGINLFSLLAEGREDPRWLTYRQAQALGARVRDDERGVVVQCWQFHELRRTVGGFVRVALTNPRLASAVVFNAEQCDGFEAFTRRTPPQNDTAALERALQKSGARVVTIGDRTRYDGADTICVRARADASSSVSDAADLLRAVVAWTDHPSRLGDDRLEPVGSLAHAEKALKQSIATFVLAHELGVELSERPHDPQRTAWAALLTADPLALNRAAATAERVHAMVVALAHGRDVSRSIGAAQQRVLKDGPQLHMSNAGSDRMPTRRYLAVPFHERREAQKHGAMLDREARCWYAGPKADHGALARWEPSPYTDYVSSGDEREQFAAVLRRLGCVVSGHHPIMDGRKHRIATAGDRRGEKAGLYRAYLSGVPHGYARNFRSGDLEKWRAGHHACTPEEIAQLRARAAIEAAERAEERRTTEHAVAVRLQREIMQLQPIVHPTPYQSAKGIAPTVGVLTDAANATTYVPAYDVNGQLWTVQYIRADGTKRFASDSKKSGCFHVIDGHPRDLHRANAFVISEGYSTAASVAAALSETGCAFIACFDASNLIAVATSLRGRHPQMPVVVAGDNDHLLEQHPQVMKNVGRVRASEAASLVGGHAVTPVFSPRDDAKLTDWNDLAQKSELGSMAVVRQIQPILQQAIAQARIAVARNRPERVRATIAR